MICGQVILAEDGDAWILEKLITTEGGDNRAIIAPRQAQKEHPPLSQGDCFSADLEAL